MTYDLHDFACDGTVGVGWGTKIRIAFDGAHLHGAGKDLYFFSAQL